MVELRKELEDKDTCLGVICLKLMTVHMESEREQQRRERKGRRVKNIRQNLGR